MSEFPAGGGPGASWSGAGGAPTPASSPNHHQTMRAMRINPQAHDYKPYQCGICYDFLTADIDMLEVHVTKHKRELAERLQSREATESSEPPTPSHHAQYLQSPSSTASSPSPYDFRTQSSSAPQQQQQQLAQFRTAIMDYRQTDEFFEHHQPPATGMGHIYTTGDNMARSAPGSSVPSMQQQQQHQQQDGYEHSLKRTRYDHAPYDQHGHSNNNSSNNNNNSNNMHAVARSELNEENTADAPDPLQEELAQGPVSFSDPQTDISYHEMQPVKSSCTSIQDSCTPRASSSFNSEPNTSLNSHHSETSESTNTQHGDPVLSESTSEFNLSSHCEKLAPGHDSGFEADLNTAAESAVKQFELPNDLRSSEPEGEAKPAAVKNTKDTAAPATTTTDGRIPRTRRSTRAHYRK